MNDETVIEMYFALCDDGKVHALGRHDDWESADVAAEKLGFNVVWLIPGSEAVQWADTINLKLAN